MLSQYTLLFFLAFSVALLLFGVYWTIKLTRALPTNLDDLYEGDYLDDKRISFSQILRR